MVQRVKDEQGGKRQRLSEVQQMTTRKTTSQVGSCPRNTDDSLATGVTLSHSLPDVSTLASLFCQLSTHFSV